jgi:pyruvate carboxylase
LRGRPQVTGRPGESLPPIDFEKAAGKVREILKAEPTRRDVVTWILYPKVYEEFVAHQQTYSDTSGLPTPVFFYGQQPGEEISLDIEPGKRLIMKYLTVGDPHGDGKRTVFFELNGQPREVSVLDRSLEKSVVANPKSDPDNPKHIGASMPGMVVKVDVKPGDTVKKGQMLLSLEAMKMTTNVHAERDAKIGEVYVRPGMQVATGDLLVTLA